MNPRLAEIIARRKELADLVKRAADMEELKKYKQELKNLQDEEALIIERARIADELAGGGGNPVPAPGNTPQGNKYDSIEYRNAFMAYVTSGGPRYYRNKSTDIC